MSVLFKALARAAKSRGGRHGGHGGGGEPASAGHPRRRRFYIIALSTIALLLVMFVGGLFLFGDEIYSVFDELTGDQLATPVPVVPRPPGAVPPQLALQTAPPAAPSAEPGSAAAPSAAPPESAASPSAASPSAAGQATTSPSGASPPAMSPSADGAAPAAAPAPAAPTIALQAPSPSPAVPAPPPSAPATGSASPVNAAPAAKVASPPPPADLPRAGPVKPTPLKVAEAKPEEDLPAILDRIRRQKAAPAMAQTVQVDRSATTNDLTGADGSSMVDVQVTAPPKQEEAGEAYDLFLHGEYEGSLDLYRKALKAAPGSLPLLLGKATAEQKLHRNIDARETYHQALSVDPENREALTNMTAIVADQAPDQALQELRGLQRHYPSFSPISAQIASIEAAQNNISGALSMLGNAIAMSPDNGLYRLNMAILQDRAGMAAEAAASYQAAIDMLAPGGNLPVPVEQLRKRMRFLQGR